MSQLWIMYFYMIFLLLPVSNVYIVWLLIELMFLFFFIIVLSRESKRFGLVIYYFFQSVMSLILFIAIFFLLDKFVFLVLLAKLGLFPFFYWVVVVSVKVGFQANMFVLSFQKVGVFWMVWLVMNCSLSLVYFLVYSRIFFVIINLVIVRDLWLSIVYSSIANTGMILISVVGSQYVCLIMLYLGVIFSIIYLARKVDSYMEFMLLVFLFLVIPPFILFFIKFYVILSLDVVLKVAFFLAIFDVLVLLYYFRLVFIKFILVEAGGLVYRINLLMLVCVLLFRNCVTLIVFNKS